MSPGLGTQMCLAWERNQNLVLLEWWTDHGCWYKLLNSEFFGDPVVFVTVATAVLAVLPGASGLSQTRAGQGNLLILLCPWIQKASSSWTRRGWWRADSSCSPVSDDDHHSDEPLCLFCVALVVSPGDSGTGTGDLCTLTSSVTFPEMFNPLSKKVFIRKSPWFVLRESWTQTASGLPYPAPWCANLALVRLRKKTEFHLFYVEMFAANTKCGYKAKWQQRKCLLQFKSPI